MPAKSKKPPAKVKKTPGKPKLPKRKPGKHKRKSWPPGGKKGLAVPGYVAEQICDGSWAAQKAVWLEEGADGDAQG